MYAIVRTGGKQYRVQPGDLLRVEKLENALGSEFEITEVLLVGGDKTYVGSPLVSNAKVTVVVTKQARDAKIVVFKKRRRQGYRRTQGHRQFFTELFVKAITSPEGQTVSSEKAFVVVDPMKKQAREEAQAAKGEKPKKAAPKKAAGAKKPAKKAAKVTKKASGKKSASKAKPKKKVARKKAK